jgi:Sugar-transfer associated ATP-grasp
VTPGGRAGMTALPARVARVVRTIRAAASAYDARLVPTGRRALRVVRRDGFHLDEAATLGILDPRMPSQDLELVASRRRLRPLQYRLNPDDSASLTEDKAVFHRACELLGLPVPRLLGLFYGDATGWGSGGLVLTSRDEWVGFIDRALPADFVLKPTHGHLGLLVRRLRRQNGGFVDESGAASTPEGLYDWMRAQRQFRSFLFQERLHSHPALVELSGTSTLQTVRIVSLVDRAGTPRIVFAGQKVVTGDSAADNLHDGKTGNAVAEIDATTGRLVRVAAPAPGAWRLVDLEAHPRTHVPFAGYQLPFWPETLDLLERAALAFLPLRTIGWDVALTPAGPVLIEGNAWWGPAPPNFLGTTAPIVRILEAEL